MDYVEEILLDPRAISRDLFKPHRVRQIIAEHRSKHRDYGDQIWRLLTLELWQRIFLDRDAHFALPPEVTSADAEPDHESLPDHIDRLWNQLTRTTKSAPPDSSLLTLPYPYVVPGGRFREMYYWDSYFTMLGLVQSGRPELAENMVRDFA